MSNSIVTVQTVFSNVKIPKGTSFTFAVPGLSPDNYYSFSVNSKEKSFLLVEPGWYSGSFAGPQCKVTNSGDATTFDLILLTATQGGKSEVKAELLS